MADVLCLRHRKLVNQQSQSVSKDASNPNPENISNNHSCFYVYFYIFSEILYKIYIKIYEHNVNKIQRKYSKIVNKYMRVVS